MNTTERRFQASRLLRIYLVRMIAKIWLRLKGELKCPQRLRMRARLFDNQKESRAISMIIAVFGFIVHQINCLY